SWNAWNVALHINNTEPLYRAAVDALKRPHPRLGGQVSAHHAATRFLHDTGLRDQRTSDGGRYSHHSVHLVMKDLKDDLGLHAPKQRPGFVPKPYQTTCPPHHRGCGA